MPNNSLPTVLIINTSDDYLDIMRLFLNAEGYIVLPIKISDVKDGKIDIVAAIMESDPKVIVYDIAFPYKENWLQFQNVLNLEVCQNREFIITTPNLDALSQQIGEQVRAYQIVDKEIDLQKIVTHVKKTWDKQKS